MKNFFVLIIIGVVAYFGWSLLRNRQETAVEPAAALPAHTPVKHLAPAGVFFVLQRVAAVPGSGNFSAAPGTKVTLVRAGAPMRVSDGRHEYDVAPAQLTNDLDRGEQLGREQAAREVEMAERQKRIAVIQQKIRDDRQAIYEAKASMGPKKTKDYFQSVIDEKGQEVLDLQSELEKLQAAGMVP